MRVLIINKFLYPNGGSETYIFKLGEALEQHGHEVQYFGMEHEGRCVGNRVNAYTSDMDFHGGSKLSKLTYPIKTIYSKEAREKLRLVLDDFKPDVYHLNNFNYQLTPSIILEIVKWRKETGRECKIIFTAHDYLFLSLFVSLNHTISICAVNCFALISGYLLTDGKKRWNKLAGLWVEVCFYSGFFAVLFNIIFPQKVTILSVCKSFFPISTNQYWYFTAYVGLFFLMPTLNAIVTSRSEQEFQKDILILKKNQIYGAPMV